MTQNSTGRQSGWLRSAMSSFDQLPLMEQAVMLTLPLLLLYTQQEWYVNVPVVCLSVAGLIFPALRRNAYLWFALVCFMATGIYVTWESSDNHKYAICYWCLAIFLALWRTGDHGQLRVAARYLLGLIFAFALLWKIISPDFVNGDFFRHAFLYDDRFSGKMSLLGLIDAETMEFDQVARDALTNFESELTEVSIRLPDKLGPLSLVLTWWTLVLEGLITVCFLVPARFKWTRLGDLLLMVFIASTYLIAPVIGFGWLLILMAVISTDPERLAIRFSYLMLLLVLQLFRLPWSQVADSFF